MIKKILISSMALLLTVSCTTTEGITSDNNSSNDVVEVMLSSQLDDSRGYCLDIAGGQGTDAPLDKGLQAHTCYHYTGSILEDQGFDAALIEEGQFKIPYYDVCMAASSTDLGSDILLEACNDSNTQSFDLQENGQLSLQGNPELCVTVSATEKKEGRGGSPVHVMRPLSLQSCNTAQQDYQSWTINEL